MTTLRIRVLVPLLVAALGLIAASCGGSDDAATEAEGSSAATGAGEGDAATTATDPAESSTSSDDSFDASSGSGGAVDAYCRAKAEAEAMMDTIDLFDPEAVEAGMQDNISLLDDAIEIAPAEIRDDLRTVRESFDDYLVVMEANDWDIFAAAPELEALDDRPEPAAAEDRIEAWEDANCDFPDDTGDDDAMDEDPFSSPEALEAMLSSDAGRAMMIQLMAADGEFTTDQAECLLDNLDIEALLALSTETEPNSEVYGLLFDVAMLCGLEEMLGFDEAEDAGSADSTTDSAVDAELLEAMMATEAGRTALIVGMTADGQLNPDQAACLLDNLEMETLVVLMETEGQNPSPEVIVALLELVDTCDLGNLFTG